MRRRTEGVNAGLESTKYLIIGGGLAGGNAATAIRERDPDGRLVLVTDESYRPYDRVPLSKKYLQGGLSREGVFLRKPEFYEEKRVEILTSARAIHLDSPSRTVTFDDGRALGFEKLLLATGGRARRLSLPGADLPGIHYLRTLEDSDGLKAAMASATQAVVVGGGFIGCEVAAACVMKGLRTTIVEVGPFLLNAALDETTGRWISEFLVAKGIRARTGERAARFIEQDGRVAGLETASGVRIPADLVVVGVGIAPNTEIAQAAGLAVDNGIVVDERLEASVPGIYAAGDVARFYSPTFERHIRVEHYDVAVRHGKIAGENMAGAEIPFADLPYFFSDMFELRTHVHGVVSDHDRIVRRGEMRLTENGGFVQFYLRGGRVMGYLGVNRKLKDERAAQKIILSRRVLDDPSVLANESVDLATLAG